MAETILLTAVLTILGATAWVFCATTMYYTLNRIYFNEEANQGNAILCAVMWPFFLPVMAFGLARQWYAPEAQRQRKDVPMVVPFVYRDYITSYPPRADRSKN